MKDIIVCQATNDLEEEVGGPFIVAEDWTLAEILSAVAKIHKSKASGLALTMVDHPAKPLKIAE